MAVPCLSDKIYQDLCRAIIQKKLLRMDSIGCASQSGSYMFDPKGDIYSCLEIVGQTQYVLGNYAQKEGLLWYEQERKNWQGNNVATSPKCSKCKFAFLCRGGCIVRKMKLKKHNSLQCENFHAMFKDAANRAYQAYLSNSETTA